MSATTINKSIFIAASKETVWSFLTDKEKLGHWFHPAADNLAQGEDFALMGKTDDGADMKICWGKVLTMNAPTELSYTFVIKPLGDASTTVTFTLEDASGGTKLTLVHEGIGDAPSEAVLGLLTALDHGWDAHFGKLRTEAA